MQNGEHLQADSVVAGIGVRPAIALAETAGLAVDRGVTVDEYLETSVPGIFAAGDIARWPDRLSASVSASSTGWWPNARGKRRRATCSEDTSGSTQCRSFWTEQYDFSLAYVGHAERFNEAEIDGQLNADTRNCTITYRRAGWKLAWPSSTGIWRACARKWNSRR